MSVATVKVGLEEGREDVGFVGILARDLQHLCTPLRRMGFYGECFQGVAVHGA